MASLEKENGCCKVHSGIDNRVEQLETRADKHDDKLDSIEKRTIAILTTVIVVLIGTVVNLFLSLLPKGGS